MKRVASADFGLMWHKFFRRVPSQVQSSVPPSCPPCDMACVMEEQGQTDDVNPTEDNSPSQGASDDKDLADKIQCKEGDVDDIKCFKGKDGEMPANTHASEFAF